MAVFDNLFLNLSYSVRGERALPPSVKVYSVDRRDYAQSLAELIENLQPRHCVLIQLEAPPHSFCQSLDLNSYFSINSLLDLKTQFAAWFRPEESLDLSRYEPYYYQSTPVPTRFIVGQTRLQKIEEANSLLIILPSTPLPPYRIDTPMGKLSNYQIVINMMGNFINNDILKNTNYSMQVLMSFSLVALFAIFLLYFPAWLSGFVLLGSMLCYFVISLIFLDQFKWVLPLAAPLLCLLLAYFLGVLDRLNSQEKEQWALKRETEFLRELDDLKNHFLSLVSHDLKTPIARIQSLLEQLLMNSENPESHNSQKTLINKALSANDQLQRSIGTLLLLNRVESRDFRIQKEPADLKQLIENSLTSLREMASERNIEILSELETLFLIELDASLIREVIYNLVDNAIKYSPSHSQILIRCGESEILNELTPPQPGVWIEIQDSGQGIDPSDRDKVLRRFYSTDSKKIPASQPIKGTGLGLYLSSFFIEKHEGQISILSRCPNEKLTPDDRAFEYFPGTQHGTVVRVALPIESLYDEGAS
jgi:signal transduction histidine kinase